MKSVVEREELHKTIWKIANDLRGSVDGWDFKSYVLGFLFYYFICENLKSYVLNSFKQDYENLSDEMAENGRDTIINAKGFFIKPSHLFSNIFKNANLENLNEKLSVVFKEIESSANGSESEKSFKGLFDDLDLYSNKLGADNKERNKKILKIMEAISELDLHYNENEIDAFGDAYEFLMTMYASNAGKSGGEFFTPQEVSKLLVEITLYNNAKPNKVYDPACGSGSLLLQYKKSLKSDPKKGYFGQEINITTYNLARMNMFLHDVNYTRFDIAHGDTLINPSENHKELEPFDAIVSNPPYSTKWEGKDNALLINDERFNKAGVLAPTSKADLAFVMHSLSWLSEKGSAAIVCFPGVMYRSGAEKEIRKYIIEENFVDCVISLAPNLFFGTSIAVCILVLRKNKTDKNTLFINANEEFIKVTNKNMLSKENLENILKLYKDRKEVPHLIKLVSIEEIAKNDYNLSVSSYVEAKDTREIIDIKALNKEIEEIVKRQSVLRNKIDSLVRELE
ncbi:type I restriction-modification system subunit M [Campylobacter jejuni]|uniref:type I restriction-modification system subunit M n=1 Tax=Campylobacter jejuni TaxID=197 RepID=UPI00127B407E|nr:type I restriction-modification system subunit M [Campylobacter jejuni]ECR1933030.1 type I restriction-modification system subunit M [Campylobacter jejuni]EDG2625063.1 type I restriction-modification system subunit M [Campylobacter jejuni]EDH2991471.1 type I restriction-modification system subunit M [Campylobacter jejuni]EDO9788277.1 type I restriction-modification system subunit M [Campylobacter jejuni]EDP3388255.1 type I restriction-modification system subunit M [Campylobacter jejuni]